VSEAVNRHKKAIRAVLRALVAGEINEVQAIAKLMAVKPHCETCKEDDASYVECSSCASIGWLGDD
jgi:hypothetical protein